MPTPNKTETGKNEKPDRTQPVPKVDEAALPNQFTRNPAEGSRKTVQRNLDRKPS